MTRAEVFEHCRNMAVRMRKNALKMALAAGNNGAHLGGGLSIIEIMATLYGHVMNYNKNNYKSRKRDRFILSKGHSTLGYYTALEAAGIISEEQLLTFEQNGGYLPGQPSMNYDLGIEYSSGSLGLGLSYGIGLAMASRLNDCPYNVYVLLGDGECNEGTVWEAAMFAAYNKVSNLTAVIDANSLQSDGPTSDVLGMDLEQVWRGFGWDVRMVKDGHNIKELIETFEAPGIKNKPRVIIAHTVKGKGVSFMENNNEWHHNRLTQLQYDEALSEISVKEVHISDN